MKLIPPVYEKQYVSGEAHYSRPADPKIYYEDTVRRKMWRVLGHCFIMPLINVTTHNRRTLAGPWEKDYEGRRYSFNPHRVILYHVVQLPLKKLYWSPKFNPRFSKGWKKLLGPLWELARYVNRSYACPTCNDDAWLDYASSNEYFECLGSQDTSNPDVGTCYAFWGWVTCKRCGSIHFHSDSTA